ncbi:MAG TPA: succinyl-diaminopimelate desuccinylase [Candidatus Dormibacteraeota bacterium]|nr:succinyl-diaminopimelate desuccinylase [Candidatus Dormibacteraeota bacterium]
MYGIATNHHDLAHLALQLVDIPSVSRHEQAVTAWLAERVAAMPHVRVLQRQDDAIVFGPPGRPDVVLAGHSDTVPEQGNLPGRLEDGWVHGLGAADMKGSLAVMLALAADLEALAPSLTPLFVVFGREEVAIEESVLAGLFDACPAILDARLALMMEPTANRLQLGCLGNVRAALTFRGVAAHSARPWLGVNAIHEAVRGLRGVAEGEPVDVVLDGLTFREVLSVTEIAGGVANNVIPDRVVCGLNFRYAGHRTPAQAEDRLRELLGDAAELQVLSNAPAAPAAGGNPLLRRLRAAGELAVEPKQAWTPVAEFAARGLDAVNLGPGDPSFAHRRDERVGVEAMATTLSVLRRFLRGHRFPIEEEVP